ncbi:hypothetical protein D3C80_1042470 [compost metagenome]
MTRNCSVWTMEMDSTPPATAICMRSTMICLAAVAMVIRPDEHWRSSVMPATETGKPAARAAMRPTDCCTPCGREQPSRQSSTSAGSTPARWTAAVRAWAASVGDGVSLKAPR